MLNQFVERSMAERAKVRYVVRQELPSRRIYVYRILLYAETLFSLRALKLFPLYVLKCSIDSFRDAALKISSTCVDMRPRSRESYFKNKTGTLSESNNIPIIGNCAAVVWQKILVD